MADLDVDVSQGIVTVTLDRPPVNAIDSETLREITRVFRGFEDDRDVRVVVFTATGERAFIAGVDLRTIGPPEGADLPPSAVLDPGRVAREAMWSITDCPVPVIAAVNGPAIGVGLALAACSDVIIAAEGATFGVTEINVGLLGASAHVSSLVGRHKAREMFFTGELVPARDLQALGAVRAVVPHDQLLATAHELASTLAAKSPLALRMAKSAMNQVEGLPLKDAYYIEQSYTARLLEFDDAAEARQAFLEKREPVWQWR